MTIYKFGVTVDDVIAQLPIDRSEVTADTELSVDDVDNYITDHAADFIGVLNQGGISDVEDLDDVTDRQASTYVRCGAVADCLDQMGAASTPGFERYRQRADRIYARYSSRPQLIRKNVQRADYSGDTKKKLRRDFTGRRYEF